MKCNQVQSLLSHYVEDDLDADTKKLLDEHFASCHNCSQELQQLKEMISELKKIPEVNAPADFVETVRERVDRPSLWKRIFQRLFVPFHIKIPLEAVAVTATVIIAIILVQKTGVYRAGQPEITTTQVAPQEAQPERIAALPQESMGAAAIQGYSGSQQYTFSEIHPRDMGSQMANADFQRMPQQQFEAGLSKSTVASQFIKKDEPVEKYSQMKKTPVVSKISQKHIILKSTNLEEDKPKIGAIFHELGIADVQVENYPDKILFAFSILPVQQEALFAKLRDWQTLSFPLQKASDREATEPMSISLELTLSNP